MNNGIVKKVTSFHHKLKRAVLRCEGKELTNAEILKAYLETFPDGADDLKWIQAADHSRNHKNAAPCTCAGTDHALFERIAYNTYLVLEQPDERLHRIANAQRHILDGASRRRDMPDYTQYRFQGQTTGKARFVLALVKRYVSDHVPINFAELLAAFPDKLQADTQIQFDAVKCVICRLSDVPAKSSRHFFMKEQDQLQLADCVAVVSREWNIENVQHVLAHAANLRYKVIVQPRTTNPRYESIANVSHDLGRLREDLMALRSVKALPEDVKAKLGQVERLISVAGEILDEVDTPGPSDERVPPHEGRGVRGHDHPDEWRAPE